MSESKEEFSFFEGMDVCIRWDVETSPKTSVDY